MTQIVTITPDGGVSGLQRKKNQGLDLRALGHAKIERATEIAWCEHSQRWNVHILDVMVQAWMRAHGGGSGGIVSHGLFLAATDTMCPEGCDTSIPTCAHDCPPDLPLRFEDYDFAVKAEVAFLDALRVQGVF